MIKPQMKIVAAPEVQKRLHEIAQRYGLTGNAVVAAAAYELSRVKPEDLWHALGRIAGEEAVALAIDGTKALPEGKKPLRRAIPA